MIKIDLITGFLGSGKTTFIKKYAKYLMDQGERVCVLENDYGAINIDMVLLNDLLGPNCELEMVVGGDGHEAHMRRFRTKLISISMQGFTRVIVEPSGIYDIDEFFDTLYDSPLDQWYEIGSIISIVDPGLTHDLSEELRYVLMSESAKAGKIVFSKLHRNTASSPDDVCSDDSNSRPDSLSVTQKADVSHTSKSIEVSETQKPIHIRDDGISDSGSESDLRLSGTLDYLNASLEHFRCKRRLDMNRDILAKDWNDLTEQDFLNLKNAGYVGADHLKLAINDDNNFQSLFYLYYSTTETDIRERIVKLFSDPETGNVIRVKGFMKIAETTSSDAQAFIEINATRDAINISPIHETQEVIIVIGENLRKNVISGYFPGATTV